MQKVLSSTYPNNIISLFDTALVMTNINGQGKIERWHKIPPPPQEIPKRIVLPHYY